MKTIILDNRKFTKSGKKKYHYNTRLRKYLHQYVWEKSHGPIPKGHEIHHIDLNSSNNDISNLQLLSIEEHRELHRSIPLSKEKRIKMLNNLRNNAGPKAAEWHGSEEGLKWHQDNYDKSRILINKSFICKCCGTEYIAPDNGHNKFCSKACKAKFRRASGVDNVDRDCPVCGKTFSINKYRKNKTCSKECSVKLRGLKDSPNL